MKARGYVKNGKLIIEDKLNLDKLEGKKVKIEIKKLANNRSIAANRYYFGVLVKAMGEAMGEEDINVVHYQLKEHFLVEVAESGRTYVKSTTDLNIKEFWKYCQSVERLIYSSGGVIDDIEYKTMHEIMNGGKYENDK